MLNKSLDAISDPVTGQRIVFRQRTNSSVSGELVVRGGGFVPLHVHRSQWERFEGVRGELRFCVGRRSRTLRPGDVLVVPPGTAHSFRNAGREEAHALIELRPPRRGEEGLRALFGLQRDGRVRVTRFGARPLLQIAVLFDEYLDEVHLPLLPFPVQRLVFGALARLGRQRGYRSMFPEYARSPYQLAITQEGPIGSLLPRDQADVGSAPRVGEGVGEVLHAPLRRATGSRAGGEGDGRHSCGGGRVQSGEGSCVLGRW